MRCSHGKNSKGLIDACSAYCILLCIQVHAVETHGFAHRELFSFVQIVEVFSCFRFVPHL